MRRWMFMREPSAGSPFYAIEASWKANDYRRVVRSANALSLRQHREIVRPARHREGGDVAVQPGGEGWSGRPQRGGEHDALPAAAETGRHRARSGPSRIRPDNR